MKKHSLTGCLLFYLLALLLLTLPVGTAFSGTFGLGRGALDIAAVQSAVWVSAKCSAAALLITVILGLPTAYYMARGHFRGKFLLDLLFDVPMILPPAVLGILLLLTFGTNGMVGKHLAKLGIRLAFTPWAVVLVLVFVALPVFIKGCCQSFRAIDQELELIAMTLGSPPWNTFWKVTLPLAKSGIVASGLMSWARAVAEFGATMMFAGNLKGVTQTMPLAIYSAMESDMGTAMLLSMMMILLSIAVLLCVELGGSAGKHQVKRKMER